MRILLITWYFPPASTIAAVRLGRFAQHLLGQGHDVRVLCARDIPFLQTLANHIPEERVERTGWRDVNALPRRVARWLRALTGRGSEARVPEASAPTAPEGSGSAEDPGSTEEKRSLFRRLLAALRSAYTLVLNWPDEMIGWLPYGLAAGRRMTRDWTPDLVFASGPPFTTFLIAFGVAKMAGVPWVLEFRDRWSDDPYYPPPGWVTRLNTWVEAFLIRRAAGLVTVSEPWAETYRARYGKEVATIYNGFDDPSPSEVQPGPPADGPLRLVYTGWIYPGRRDPSPVMEAIELLGVGPDVLRLEFYGTAEEHVRPLARMFGIEDQVFLYPEIAHKEAIRIQRNADVLLMMQWDNPKEQGNIPGKFFEYLGSGRPILVLGLEDGVPATFVRERSAGFYGRAPSVIADQLREWISMKREGSGVPPVSDAARQGFSREQQFDRLEAFLDGLLR